jgi:hypothetical protein
LDTPQAAKGCSLSSETYQKNKKVIKEFEKDIMPLFQGFAVEEIYERIVIN